MNSYPGFLETRVGETSLITIDRPDARNAMTTTMRKDFALLFGDLDADDDVSVVVLTGSDPSFTAGVDLKERLAGGAPLPLVRPNPGEVLRAFSKPVICAVNGPCVTGGLEIALSCTFVVASSKAEFKDTHARLGIMPGWGLSALLPRAVGSRAAAEMALTGRVVGSDEALRLGLVNAVVPHDDLLPAALERANLIAGADGAAVRALLALYRRGDGAKLDDALVYEREAADAWRTDAAKSLERLSKVTGNGRTEN